jgi:hypothetical protein
MRRRYVVRDGKVVEGGAEARPIAEAIPGQGDGRGTTVQLPKNYPYAKSHLADGTVCWNTQSEARDVAKRAQDHGEDLSWDR